MINQFYIDYIKAIENPDRVGWNGKVWTAPQYKGYDKNQRGYGIDIVKNDSAKRLTQNRPGQWLTEEEADKLMREHLQYVYGAAQKHIEGFDNLSDRRKAALLGMLYRGDSVNKNRHIIDINEPDDNKFFESISNYYKSKGLNERARNSSNFFNNQQTNFQIPMKWEQWEPPMKFKNGGLIRKMQTAAGGPIQLTPEEQKYLEWSKMTPEQKREYRNNRINAELQRGPDIKHFWEAFQTYIGNRDPENPNLNIGIVNATPGRATPQQIQQSAKLMETINKYWKSLGKLKVRLSGGRATSGILTKPGTAPTTFNGQNINYITSPKGGNVTHKFYTDQGSEYILTKDGFARRVKSPHNNTLGQGSGPMEWNAANSDAGLHNWNEGTTIFTEGEDGKLFNTAFYKLNDFGFKPGTYGLARKGEKARIMLIDPKTKQWRAAMLSDVYPTTVKQGLQADRVMETNYSDVPKLGWHILEKANGGWHPGSPVAFIEGLKQGGKMNILEFLKKGSGIHIKEKNKGSFTRWCGGNVTSECIKRGKNSSNPKIRKKATFADNAGHFKHKKGGKAFVNGVNILDSNPDAYKHVKKKKYLYGGTVINWSPIQQSLQWQQDNSDYIRQKEEQKLQQKIREEELKAQKINTITNGITSIGGQLLQNLPIFKSSVKTTVPSANTISNTAKNTFWE